jgi:hypothetical protein
LLHRSHQRSRRGRVWTTATKECTLTSPQYHSSKKAGQRRLWHAVECPDEVP